MTDNNVNRRGFLKLLGLTGVAAVIPSAILEPIVEEIANEIPEPDHITSSLQYILGDRVYNIGDLVQFSITHPEPIHVPIMGYGHTPAFRSSRTPEIRLTVMQREAHAREVFEIWDAITSGPLSGFMKTENYIGTLRGRLSVPMKAGYQDLIEFELRNALLMESSDLEFSQADIFHRDLTFQPVHALGPIVPFARRLENEKPRIDMSMHRIGGRT